MKRIFPICFMAFYLISCGDSDNDKKDDPQPITPTQPAKIDGTWHLYEVETVSTDPNGNVLSSKKENYNKTSSSQIFTPPATYSSTINGNSATGTYQIKQDSLIITYPSETVRAKIDSLTSTRLVYHQRHNVFGDIFTITSRSTR